MPQIKLNENTYGGNIYDTQPIGEVIELATDKNPAGYLPCDGRSVKRSDYPDLFKKIGTTFGAEDDEHFNLPTAEDVDTVSTNQVKEIVAPEEINFTTDGEIEYSSVYKVCNLVTASFKMFYQNKEFVHDEYVCIGNIPKHPRKQTPITVCTYSDTSLWNTRSFVGYIDTNGDIYIYVTESGVVNYLQFYSNFSFAI